MENNGKKLEKIPQSNRNIERLLLRLALQVGWFVSLFLMINILSFLLIRMMPGTPFTPTADSRFNPDVIATLEQEYGLNKPLIVQFFIHLKNVITGNWGYSITLSEGQPVWDLIWEKLPLSLEIVFLTILVALPISLLAGAFAGKFKKKLPDVIIVGGMAIFWYSGIFVVGIFLQYLVTYKLDWFPSQGYMRAYYGEIMNLYQVTGFGLLDSLLAGKFTIFIDILHHLFLPIATLFLPTVVMLTWIIRRITIKVKTKTSLHFFNIFGYFALFASIEIIFLMALERTFSLNGGSRLLLDVIENQDYFVIQALVIGISVFILVVSTFWGMVGIFIDYIKGPIENPEKSLLLVQEPVHGEPALESTHLPQKTPIEDLSDNQTSLVKATSLVSFKNVALKWIFNPFVISSIILFLIFGILALIAPLLFDKAPLQDMHMGFDDFRPPMLEHPLGTTIYGQDVLGRLIWGIRIPMLLLIFMSIVGVIGLCVGYFTNFKNVYLRGVGKFIYSGVFRIPFMILIILTIESIGDRNLGTVFGIILVFVYLLMAWAGFYIHNQMRQEENEAPTDYWQRLLKAIHLGLVALGIVSLIGIMLYFTLSFLGYGARNEIEWGWDVNRGQTKLLVAPWAAMWPGAAILIFELPFILWIYGSWYAHVKLHNMKQVSMQEI
jgi:ABC-type dipeptide/oligopeptide/nickel transport system permease component/ABC-type antimicrobial peptide transport system permease subunit